MARIAGVDLPKPQARSLSRCPYLYGVGRNLAKEICRRATIPQTKKTEELTEARSRGSVICSRPTSRSRAIFAAKCR